MLDSDHQPRCYVIGDIHGRSDLLDRMVDAIARDVQQSPTAKNLTVTLGDYVDRGPDSRGVLDRLVRNPFPTDYIAVKGNHEELFETFLTNPETGPQWRRLGGLETLHSYKVPVTPLMLGKGFNEAAQALRQALPEAHAAFIRGLKLSLIVGGYFFCHAGVRPGVALEKQRAEDLLWIRDEFLSSKAPFGRIVVHGHTPTSSPEVLANRINIDTGAFATGRLTCLVIEDSGLRFLST